VTQSIDDHSYATEDDVETADDVLLVEDAPKLANGEWVLTYGLGVAAVIPRLGLDRESSNQFDKQLARNLPKVLEALVPSSR
jgi:hypothetical protein